MTLLHKLSIATAVAVALSAQAQTPTARPASPPNSSAPAATDRMAMMDTHMNAMREMHDKMMRARTTQERNALMAEQMKLMQDGIAMMGGMGGMGGMKGMGTMPADMAGRQQMMEKRMDMMEMMMKMMVDREAMKPPAAK